LRKVADSVPTASLDVTWAWPLIRRVNTKATTAKTQINAKEMIDRMP
jgi:hypothetical protein